MADNVMIRVDSVTKAFKLPHEKQSSLKGAFISSLNKKRTYETQTVLNDISFEVKKGEFFGIVGRNGSGKSTLLKLLAGIYEPNQGTITVNGRLTPFIELGVGFNQELTGKENVYLNSALLGFNRKQTEAMYNDIVDFAELGQFMDQKLKNYSSGMQVRLAFSIAIRTNSDILLIDEVLAVGDASFQKKCFDYFRTLKKEKKTVVFISHDMNAVREYCDRAVLIDKGVIISQGKPEAVAQAYTRQFQRNQNAEEETEDRWGNGDASINKVTLKEINDKNIIIEADCIFNKPVEEPVFGFQIFNPFGQKIIEANTLWNRQKTGNFAPKDRQKVQWEIPNIFTNGDHGLTVAVSARDGGDFFDWWEQALTITIDKDQVTTAVTLPEQRIRLL